MSTDTSILLLLADLQADKVALIAERDALRDENQQLREALAAASPDEGATPSADPSYTSTYDS